MHFARDSIVHAPAAAREGAALLCEKCLQIAEAFGCERMHKRAKRHLCYRAVRARQGVAEWFRLGRWFCSLSDLNIVILDWVVARLV